MISALYKLDLESINNMITEINRDLSKKSPFVSPVQDTNRLFSDIEIGAPCSEIVAEDLALDDTGLYRFCVHLYNTATTTYSLYFNNDKNGPRYHQVELHTTNGAAVQASNASTPTIPLSPAANDSIIIVGTISVIPDVKHTYIHGELSRELDDSLCLFEISYHMKPEHTNIFKLSIESSTSDALIKNSHLRIWRMY